MAVAGASVVQNNRADVVVLLASAAERKSPGWMNIREIPPAVRNLPADPRPRLPFLDPVSEAAPFPGVRANCEASPNVAVIFDH